MSSAALSCHLRCSSAKSTFLISGMSTRSASPASSISAHLSAPSTPSARAALAPSRHTLTRRMRSVTAAMSSCSTRMPSASATSSSSSATVASSSSTSFLSLLLARAVGGRTSVSSACARCAHARPCATICLSLLRSFGAHVRKCGNRSASAAIDWNRRMGWRLGGSPSGARSSSALSFHAAGRLARSATLAMMLSTYSSSKRFSSALCSSAQPHISSACSRHATLFGQLGHRTSAVKVEPRHTTHSSTYSSSSLARRISSIPVMACVRYLLLIFRFPLTMPSLPTTGLDSAPAVCVRSMMRLWVRPLSRRRRSSATSSCLYRCRSGRSQMAVWIVSSSSARLKRKPGCEKTCALLYFLYVWSPSIPHGIQSVTAKLHDSATL
mmetsp:Transcript_41877/g.102672  ORF Transcript_41877/g.102672 Transcript_41877/m.102672 type:complete len:383 (+) Transcript_41877:660-1808(+)